MLTVVLLPGMDGTGTLFEPFVAALGTEFRIKVVSYPTSEPLGYTQLESLVRAALPTHEPYVILGESFSGPIAVALAAAGAPQLKGVVLCCSFIRNPRPIFAMLKPMIGFLPIPHVPVKILGYFLLGRYATTALRQALARAVTPITAAVRRARIRDVLTVYVSAQLTTVHVPMLYLQATHDRVVPPSAAKLITHLSPHVKIIRVEAPHFLLQTKPSEAAQIVSDFVRKVGETR